MLAIKVRNPPEGWGQNEGSAYFLQRLGRSKYLRRPKTLSDVGFSSKKQHYALHFVGGNSSNQNGYMARFLLHSAALRNFSVLVFATLFGAVFPPARLSAQTCGCSNCPQEIADEATVDLFLQVTNAASPTLGQNGQGVCGVILNFDHEYLSDLTVKLTSPAGQTVTLLGPAGFFEPTNFTTWNVTFLQCGDAADPDGSFSAQWANDQGWGTAGSYTGSYHPFLGCLENLNLGPVNGTWTLTVTDAQENDLGNFYDYQIIFCDPTGVTCLTCQADAGNLLQPDLTACEKDDTLKLSLPPAYAGGQTAPPDPQYAYRYVLAGTGGTILSYIATPDLRQLPAGDYTLCGLSYLAAQSAKIPPPNGTLTVQQLATALSSTNPPFCGDLTANCVGVKIHPVPPNTTDTVVVCFPDCYIFGGDTLCQSGTYTDTMLQNGCAYTATILLRIQLPDTVQVQETICQGQCSATPGFGQNCAPGVFLKTFQSQAGCDSTVVLTLSVLYVDVKIAPPDTLECNRPTVPLLGSGSSTGTDISYQWRAKNGGQLVGPTNNPDAVAGKPGIYQLKVCRTDATGAQCCDSLSTTVIKQNVPPPAPGPIAGLNILCLGQTASYTIASVPGASTYNWLLPPGASWVSGQGDTSLTLLWNSPTASAICVTAADSCGNLSTPRCRTVQTGQVAPPLQTPQGSTTACRETPETYQIPPFTGASNYEWTVNAPHSIASGQGTHSVSIAWGNAPTAQVCVKITNNCGTSPTGCLNVAVSALPAAPTLSGSTQVCRLDTFTYDLAPVNGAAGYNWTVSGGQVLSGQGTTQIQVVWDGPAGTGSVCADAQNDCGISQQSCLNVQSGTPPTLGQVTRSCDPANQNYFVSFPVTGGAAPFSVSGGTVSGGVFTSSPIPNSVPYSFVLTDANGCLSAKIKGNYDCNCTSRAGQLGTQALIACEGGMVTAVAAGTVIDPNDLSVFLLHSDSSATTFGTIFGQNASGTFGLQNGMTYGTRYYVTHLVGNPLNGLPDPDDPCYSTSNTQPVVFYKNPIANAGANQASCGKTIALSASGPGQWAVTQQPLGANLLLSNAQSPTALATADSTGVYQLTWTVLDANGCVGQDMVDLRFHPRPALANLTRTCDAANQNYVVALTLTNGTPPYTVNSIPLPGSTFTSASFANGQTFSFAVSDGNGCTMQPVTGAYDCNCTSDAGTMSGQLLEVCAGKQAQSQGNSDLMPDPDDVTGFVLHDGSGPTLGKVLAQNTSGAFGFLPGMEYGKTYYISRMVGNSANGLPNPLDPCFSVSPGQPVVFYQKPAPYAGKDTVTCGQKIDLQAVKGNYDGQWSVVSGPGTAMFSVPNDPQSEVQVSAPGTYTLGWTEQNEACTATDAVVVKFNAMPEFANFVEICNSTNSGYSLKFDMVSGDAPFTISGIGGTFTGATFVSEEFATNAPYLLFVSDANGCRSPETFGSHNCVCVTDAGTMQVVPPTTYCAGETVSAIWNNNPVLDADDIVEFILHDQPGSLVGNILARNTQPVFAYQPNFLTGTVYYISALAGSASNGTVNLADKCLSVTPGVPVFWKALPTAEIYGTDTICVGDAVVLSLSGTGGFPLKLTYTDGTSLFELPLTGPQVVTLMPSPAATTTYQLLSVEDATNPVCAVPLMGAATVTVNRPLRAGTSNDTLDLCEGDIFPFQLINLLTDADFGGVWTDVSAPPALPGSLDAVTGTFQTAGQALGTYRFRYAVTSSAPCPSDAEEVEVRISRPPDADAGENKALNCDQLSALLEGSSTAANVVFTWLLQGDTVGIAPQVFVQDSGRYTLVVTNQFGCTATDSVQVDLATQPPQATFSTTGVRCFGDRTGSISVDSILVGEPPVLFAFNGGAFGASRTFGSLAPGLYTVMLQDANGCEWTSDSLLVPQPPPVLANLGPDVSVHLGDSVTLGTDLSHPLAALKSIVWRPLLDTASAGKTLQHFLPLHSLLVAVEVTDTNGCKGQDLVWVFVNRDRHIFVPNIISPQSSENGTALIYGGDDVEIVEVFQIFDRWGDELFSRSNVQPNDSTQGWNGKSGRDDVLPGVYVWRAQVRFVDGQSEVFFGSVTVVR